MVAQETIEAGPDLDAGASRIGELASAVDRGADLGSARVEVLCRAHILASLSGLLVLETLCRYNRKHYGIM